MTALLRKAFRGTGRAVSTVIDIPRRVVAWSGRRPRAASVLAGALAVVLLGVTATFTALHLRDESTARASAAASAAAKKAVPELLSYDHTTLAAQLDSRIELLTGPFKADYGKLLREEVLPAAEQSKLVTTSTVVGVGTDSAGADRVELLMFVNQSTGAAGAAPATAASRISVTMERAEDRWLVSGLKPV